MPHDPPSPLIVPLADEAATAALAEDIAACLLPGDVVALSGDLGAGKTTLARALIRVLAGDPALEVPSPTFTLVQTYATPRLMVAHVDLYRLSSEDEVDEIGLADSLLDGAALIEWPERAGARLPAERLTIALAIEGSGRRAGVSGVGPLWQRYLRSRAARAFLDAAGWPAAERRHLEGDASTRTYERICRAGRRAVLMDWPPRGQFAPGDPRAAFRARDAGAWVAVANALRAAGLSTPEIYAADIGAGFLLMEDFGSQSVAVDDTPDAERYRVAIEALAHVHATPRPAALPLPGGSVHTLPHFAGEVLFAELRLFTDACVPLMRGSALSEAARDELMAIWRDLAGVLAGAEQSWVLFDVQSPNLFWLGERTGIARVGFIDFQDMFVGPAAYDVAALCQDARVTIPPEMEAALRAHYVARRRAAGAAFDAEGFAAAAAVAGSLRTLKNMGAFAHMGGRGNTKYFSHLPRLRAYLARLLREPVLTPFARWYEEHLPPP